MVAEQNDGLGPIDYLVVEFPGNKFNGDVVPALTALIARGLVRVLDLAFVAKDDDGNVVALEIEDLEGLDPALQQIAGFLADLVTEDDLLEIAQELPAGSSAAVIVWENTWAARFASAVRESGGEVVATGRLITSEVLEALEAAAAS